MRHEKANLLGYPTHADFTLKRRMAQSKDRVYKLIDDLIEPSYNGAKKEIQAVKDYALKIDGLEDFQAWDSSYYGELLKQSIYDFDEECLRPYFNSQNVIKGVFEVANKLYGLNFEQLYNIDVYHEDVKVYKVIDIETNNLVGPVIQNLWMPHNIQMINGALHVLNSLPGQLLTNNFQVIGEFPAFTRGLDHDGVYYYIGQSRNRNYSKNIGVSNNISIDAGIIVFDDQTKASRFLQLPSKLSEVHSILII